MNIAGGVYYCSSCSGALSASWVLGPCPTLRLAEDKLRLAEALEAFEQWQGQVIPVYNDEFFHASDVREHAQKALSEVVR